MTTIPPKPRRVRRREELVYGQSDGDALDSMRTPVGEVMTRDVLCVPPSVSIDVIEELLLDSDLSGVPVVDDERRLVGYVAMNDIVRELREAQEAIEHTTALRKTEPWGFHVDPPPKTVADVMTVVALELAETCPVAEAVRVMANHNIDRVPIVSYDGTLVGVVTAGDIVHHLAISAASAPVREKLVEADRLASLEFLASGIAHQINNALTSSRLTLGRLRSFELARRTTDPEGLHRIELLQDVREGVARIERVARELHVFAHDDDGPARPMSVVATLETAIGFVAHQVRHRAQLVCDYAAVPPVRAKGGELRQVLVNILVNATQAIPEGEAHVNEIRISTRTDERGRALIEIRDTGTGIPSDVMNRVYEPFFTTHKGGHGLGIGLAVARDVITSLDGEIGIESVVGQGTTVRIWLPPCAEAVTAVGPAVEPPRDAATSERLRILVVDDDRPVAVAVAFELAEHDVTVAESGREALEIIRKDKTFDVILCDLMMPEVSGMDVYESVRLVDPHLRDRIAMMTGGAFTPRARAFLSITDVPVIQKPFLPGQLQSVIAALDRRRNTSPLGEGTPVSATPERAESY